MASCREGLALAEALGHPFSIGIALWAAGILHQLRREPDAMRQIGERMIHYGGEKGLRMIVPLSLLAMFEGATVTLFDGRFGELAAWARGGRACRRACGGQDVAWKGR